MVGALGKCTAHVNSDGTTQQLAMKFIIVVSRQDSVVFPI